MTTKIHITGRVQPYRRASTDKQDHARQIHLQNVFLDMHPELKLVALEPVDETISSRKKLHEREIGRVIQTLRSGDALLISDLPRLGRDFFETISILHDLLNKGIGVISIEDNYVLTDSLTSKIIASGLLMAAEIQREYISRNTKAKLAAKKAEGHKLGRPEGSRRISPKVIENLAAIRKYEKAGVSQEAIARLIGVSRSTLIRNLRMVEEEGED